MIQSLGFTWTPKACKIMALMAVMFYILLGFRGLGAQIRFANLEDALM